MFHREVKSLITVRHQNIVRFLGYCSFTEERMVSIEGGTIVVDIQERLLCFEYMSNGSLDSHLTGTLSSSCYLMAGFFPILYLDLCYKSFFLLFNGKSSVYTLQLSQKSAFQSSTTKPDNGGHSTIETGYVRPVEWFQGWFFICRE